MNRFSTKSSNSHNFGELHKIRADQSSVYQSKGSSSYSSNFKTNTNANIIKSESHQFRIENSGKLYGQGCNLYGKLGLGNRKYVQ